MSQCFAPLTMGLWCSNSFFKLKNYRFSFLAVFASFVLLLSTSSYALPASSHFDSLRMEAMTELAVAMDKTVDPCQDFFQYACGGWIQKNPIPTSKSGWSQFDILNDKLNVILKDILEEKSKDKDSTPLKKARQMYAVCLDTCKRCYILYVWTRAHVINTHQSTNTIHWRLVDALALDTNQRMADLQFAFAKVFDGVKKPTSRANTCVDVVNGMMGHALGSAYVEKVFDDHDVAEIKVMIANLKRAFKSLVNETPWMDSATKSIAIEKVDAMIDFVGYPSWIRNITELEDYYYGIPEMTHSHFQNVQQVDAFIKRGDLSGLRAKNDLTEWDDPPTVVNAFYSETINSIYFPAAVLQPPFFGKGRSAAMNYGAMGAMIGHEITHGFDDRGRQSDKNGNTVQWWTEKTLANYQERAKCFIDQYTNYTVLDGIKLDGVNTQGENIADNGGLREAWRAFRYYLAENGTEASKFENFTAEQTFFLSYANSFCGANAPEEQSNLVEMDSHSPFRYRVIGTLSNNEDFVREFKCAAGTPMNRLNKCILW